MDKVYLDRGNFATAIVQAIHSRVSVVQYNAVLLRGSSNAISESQRAEQGEHP